jgi:hypothetical protein
MKKSGTKTKESTDSSTRTIDTDVADMVAQIQKWQIEAYSPYNDGWTQAYYREKIRQIKEILGVYEEPIRVIT